MSPEDQAEPESSAVEDEWDVETWADNDEVVVCSVDSYEICESCQ